MANLTLTQARVAVRELVDDKNGVRWSDTATDTALSFGINSCLIDYATAGGDRFDLETTGTTTVSVGTLSLSSVVPLRIKSVAYEPDSTTRYEIRTGGPKVRMGKPDEEARPLRVFYVREYVIPTDASHPLIGVGATAANSWPDFDAWVCAVAAQHMLIKDAALVEALERVSARRRESVLGRINVPNSEPWPLQAPFTPTPWLRWYWTPGTSVLHLGRAWGYP